MSKKNKLNFLVPLTAFSLLAALSGCGPSEAEIAAEKAKQQKKIENEKIEQLKNKLTKTLKDPSSALFQDTIYIADSNSLCGQINAKNSFGGYVGFKWFGVSMDSDPVILKRLTLAQTLQSNDELLKYTAELFAAGDKSAMDDIPYDIVMREQFPHWEKCNTSKPQQKSNNQ